MNLQPIPTVQPAAPVGFSEIIAVFRRRQRAVVLFLLTGLLASLLLAYNLPEVYTAQAKLVLEPRDTGLFEAVPEVRKQELNRETIETEMELIDSRLLAGRIVDKLDLVSDPFFNPYLQDGEVPLPEEQQDNWWQTMLESSGVAENSSLISLSLLRNHVAGFFDRFRGPGSEERVTVQPTDAELREQVISDFLNKFQVSRFGQSLAIQIEVAHTEAARTAEIANAIADTYLNLSTENHRTATKKAINFLSERSDALAAKVSTIEQEIANHRVAYRLDDPNYATALRAEIEQLKVKLTLARSGSARAADGSASGEPRLDAAAIEEQLAEQTRLLTERNKAEIDLRQMEREAASGQERYKQVIARLGNLDLQAEPLNRPGRVLSYAQVPKTATSPKRTLIVFAGVTGAIVLAALYILLREGTDKRIRSETDVASQTNVPAYGLIPEVAQPWWKPRAMPHEYARARPFSHYADTVRHVLNCCTNAVAKRRTKTVLVTSCVSDEGKSSTALSMAVLSASDGDRTVLLDLDLQKCGASHAAGIRKDNRSLDEYLAGECELDEVVYKMPGLPELDVIGFARYPNSARNMLGRETIEALVNRLKNEYATVIIDAPPVLITGSASMFARFVDSVLLIVRWGRTDKDAMINALSKLRSAAKAPIGIAISRVDFKQQSRMKYDPTARFQAFAKYYHQN